MIENASWRWVFYVNLPIALVVLSVAALKVPESKDEEMSGALDWRGALLATIGLGALIFGLIESGTRSLSDPLVLISMLVGVVGLIVFYVVQSRIAEPMMPLGLFSSPTFSGSNLLTLLLYAALGGALFFLPFNLMQVQGYSATAAGAAFLPFIIAMFLLSRWSGGLVTRFGARLPLVVGPIIAAAGFALMAVPNIGGRYWTTFFPATVVLGLGMAICVAPLTTTVMNSVPIRHAGVASGINNAVSRVASLLAIAVFGIVVLGVFTRSLDARLAELAVHDAVHEHFGNQRIKMAAADMPLELYGADVATLQLAVQESFVAGFKTVMVVAAVLAVIGAIVAGVMIEGKSTSPPLPGRR